MADFSSFIFYCERIGYVLKCSELVLVMTVYAYGSLCKPGVK